LALAGSAAQCPVYPYQFAVRLKELEVVCETAGTSLAIKNVRELEREPFGVVAIVVVPLTDEIAIGGVQRDIPEPAERQSV
jgi:hypothetical protein